MNQLWQADLRQLAPGIEERLMPMLSHSEQQKLDRLQQSNRRNEFILSRALMRMALSENYHQPYEAWQFLESPNAAPKLETPHNGTLLISLSHSAHHVVLAISDQAVGIDIERVQARKQYLSIARKVFTPAQQASFSGLTEQQSQQKFFELWTQKEALVKAMAGTVTEFQMISTAAWPLQGFHFTQKCTGAYCITLAAKYPASAFKQFKATAFADIKSCTLF